MDAERRDHLREWLVRTLEPICDADPEVLSKYVLALVTNNPQVDTLRDVCLTKLEEFLGDETAPFVTRLLTVLETGRFGNEQEEEDGALAPPLEHQHSSSSQRAEEETTMSQHSRARPSDDEERARSNKRRREGEHARDEREYSPRRSGDNAARREVFNGRPGRGRGEWERDDRGRGHPANTRRRNFAPEWGMPPPGMWPPPPYGAGPGFAPMPDFDPSAFPPDAAGMMPPPHMMMPTPMGPPFYPYGGARGRGRGRGGYTSNRVEDANTNGGAGETAGGATPPAHQGAKTTLRVSNVDPKYINMTKLSLHFSKFGNVVNVQMRPSYRCAYVQYATEEEAKKAFHSPIPVCNNRFIEVKWAKYDARDPQGAPSEEVETGAGTSPQAQGDAAASTPTGSEPATPDAAGTSEMTPEELRASALETGRKVLEAKRELLEKQRQLQIKKETLLKKQLAQQKELLERMSQNSASVSSADKRELLLKITALSEELKTLQSQKEGSDAQKLSGLKAELSALEAQAASRGSPYAGRGSVRGGRWSGGRGAFRGGRGGRGNRPHFSQSLDNRTTIVRADHLPEEARDVSVLEQHFGNFGGIERVILDESKPDRAYIKFYERYAGQTALTRGAMYAETKLDMAWVETQDAPSPLRSQTPTASQSQSQSQPQSTPTGSLTPSSTTESKEVSASA